MTRSVEPLGDFRQRPRSWSADRLPRLLPDHFGTEAARLGDHHARHGEAPSCSSDADRVAIVAEIERAGLRGRGGAGYPTARKLRAVRAQGRSPVVIANGTEGEPASAKDKVLLACAPHLVLDGVVLAAELIGATDAIVVVHHAVRAIVDAALAERTAIGLDRVRIQIVTSADRFVAGEASAVVNWVERGVPVPRITPPRLAARGLHGRPTLVQNVETLAHLALIARHGAGWYRALGTAEEPGSMLVTLSGALQRPGVYEIEIGIPLRDLLEVAGGTTSPLVALLLGGYFGSCVTPGEAEGSAFSAAGLAPIGAGVGAGLVVAIPSDVCGLVETARVVRYLASQSAGQCGPCVFGLDAVAGKLEQLATGGAPDLPTLHRWLDQIDGRGACHHPDGVVRFVRSALKVFEPEIGRHAAGWCCGRSTKRALPVPELQRP